MDKRVLGKHIDRYETKTYCRFERFSSDSQTAPVRSSLTNYTECLLIDDQLDSMQLL